MNRKLAAVTGLAALAVVLGALTAPAPARASVTITQDSLVNSPEVPYSGENVTPTLKVHSSACITVQALVVTARDSSNNNVGWGGNWNNPVICPSGYTLTPNPRSFTTGTYTEFGAYLLNNAWTNLPSQVLQVTATQIEPSWNPNGTLPITFDDEFNDTSIGSAWSGVWWLSQGGTPPLSRPGNQYMTACYDARNDSISGGAVHLKLDNTASNCGQQRAWTGAVLDTYGKFAQAGGAFEASVHVPCTNGQVIGWPAWWVDDPSFSNELDIMEGGSLASGVTGGTAVNMHYSGGNPGWASPSPYCGWHRFGAQWDNTGQTAAFYWDSREVFTHSFPVGSGNPVYLIFDFQQFANGIAPPGGSATMDVDWVRAWK